MEAGRLVRRAAQQDTVVARINLDMERDRALGAADRADEGQGVLGALLFADQQLIGGVGIGVAVQDAIDGVGGADVVAAGEDRVRLCVEECR